MRNLKKVLLELKNVKADIAVSVFINTHRTFPDNQQDAIALKNQLKQLEDRLTEQYDAKTADSIMSKIQHETEQLDPNYNLDSLAVFATQDQVHVLRLPFAVQPRIVIAQNFETRDFVRELSYSVNAYVVVITREIGRLIEVSNDQVIHEFSSEDEGSEDLPHGAFPVENSNLFSTSGAERANASNDDNYLKEFLNRVDKNVQAIRNANELPLIIVGDSRNISFYESVCDRPQAIIATVSNVTQLDDGDAQHIVDGIQEEIDQYRIKRDEQALAQLDAVYGQETIRTDLQSIYQAALEGNAATLYVQRGYMQSGHLDAEHQKVDLDESDAEDQSNDVVSQLIDLVAQNGGENVFLPAELLEGKAPLVLVTRY